MPTLFITGPNPPLTVLLSVSWQWKSCSVSHVSLLPKSSCESVLEQAILAYPVHAQHGTVKCQMSVLDVIQRFALQPDGKRSGWWPAGLYISSSDPGKHAQRTSTAKRIPPVCLSSQLHNRDWFCTIWWPHHESPLGLWSLQLSISHNICMGKKYIPNFLALQS